MRQRRKFLAGNSLDDQSITVALPSQTRNCHSSQRKRDLHGIGELRALEAQDRALDASAEYGRVVLWFEHDGVDQLSLVHLLGHYATHRRPQRLELINIGDFPSGRRFTGLGQLPPEALRLLWATRRPISAAQLSLGLDAWHALANPDPRPLAAIMRGDTAAMPFLAAPSIGTRANFPRSSTACRSLNRWR